MAKLNANGDTVIVKLSRTENHPQTAKVDVSETTIVITSSGRVLERWAGKAAPGSTKKTISTGWRVIGHVRPGPKTVRKMTRSWCGRGFRITQKYKA